MLVFSFSARPRTLLFSAFFFFFTSFHSSISGCLWLVDVLFVFLSWGGAAAGRVGSGRVESSQIELVSGSCFSGFFILFAVFHLFGHGNLLSLYDISR